MELIFSLVAGLIIALALQLLLANLGIALGLSVLSFAPGQQKPSSGGSIALPITHLLGFGVALSLSTVLFVAGLLTTEFSQIPDPRRGLIFGIILWATYWLLFVWLSSMTLSNMADSLLDTALAGGRRLIKTLGQQWGEPEHKEQAKLKDLAEEISELAEKQEQLPQRIAAQQEALLAEIRDLVSNHEVAPANHPTVSPAVEELETTASSSFTPSSLASRLNLPSGRQLLQRTINQVDTSNINIQTLWNQIRSDNSKNVIELDIVDYLRETPVWMFQPTILKETFYDRIYDPKAAPEQIKAQLAKLDRAHFVDWLQERGDLAAEQIETIADQLSQIKGAVMETVALSKPDQLVDKAAAENIQRKLISYCRYTNLELLSADSLAEKVADQLMEHALESSPGLAKQFDLEAIQAVLERRRGLKPAQQQTLMMALRSALDNSPSASQSERLAPRRWVVRQPVQNLSEQLINQVNGYLQHQDKSAFQPAQMVRDLTHLAKASWGSLSDDLPAPLFDRETWQQQLEKRRDMTADEIQQILTGAESSWQQAFHQVNNWAKTSWSEVQATLASKNDAFIDTAQQQITEGLSAAQQTLETKANAVKADLQTQADAARGQVAIAAWWLFSSLLLSGVSAATSGWLAATY